MTEGVLVIGVGHPDRGDDAAGLRVAEGFAARHGPAEVILSDGDPLAMLEAWDGRDLVVVVDAVVGSGDPPGTLVEIEALEAPVPGGMIGSSSHVLGLSEAISLGKLLGQTPRRLVVLGVVGERFELGTGPGPEVLRGIGRAVDRCLELVRTGVVARRVWLARGTVQGVGFRPFVARLARELGLSGHVRNTVNGVEIDLEGPSHGLTTFRDRLRSTVPFDQLIVELTETPAAPRGVDGVDIRPSDPAGTRTAWVTPDQAMCPSCAAEIRDRSNRRYRYPFTTCAQCGPRYSILRRLPFDREHTVMDQFPMCPTCRAEYDDPQDRRYHAQTITCPTCGPRLSLTDGAGTVLSTGDDALRSAASAVGEGRVVAVLGIGGFQLWVDARNAAAVELLRTRKKRPRKPFAVMVRSVAEAREHARVTELEATLLAGPRAPIVLLDAEPGSTLASGVAPGMGQLGLFLPTTPLHALLLDEVGGPVVATSGNPSGEPLCIDPDEGRSRLGGMADLFLVHDRPVLRPVDDSVVRMVDGAPVVVRAARGYAPFTHRLTGTSAGGPPAIALGAFLKSSVAISTGHDLVVSSYLGDAGSPAGRILLERTARELLRLYGIEPELVAHDLHPDLPATRLAEVLARAASHPGGHAGRDAPRVAVQHHHAHAVAALLDADRDGPALALTWDGTGLGADGTVWGGEALVVTRTAYERVGRFRPFRLLGGDAAVADPRRVAFVLLRDAEETDSPRHPVSDNLSPSTRSTILRALERGIHAPWTSSLGRLLDGIAAILGVVETASYEGEPAIVLEEVAARAARSGGPGVAYPFSISGDDPAEVDWRPMVRYVVDEWRAGRDPARIAIDVHWTVAAMGVALAKRTPGLPVILTGGCFQNRILTERLAGDLRACGREVIVHRALSPGDGAISVGQLAHALAMAEVASPSPPGPRAGGGRAAVPLEAGWR